MKKAFLLLFASILTVTVANAQKYESWAVQQAQQRTAYYTPKQCNRTSIWIDGVEFAADKTVVNLHSINGGGINFLESTKLVCYLSDGRIKVLGLNEATIKIGGNEYSQLERGDSFKAYFPALSMSDVLRIKRIDFLENEGARRSNVFNITNIKISKKRLVVL